MLARFLGWIGNYQAVRDIIQSDFVRTILSPLVYAMLTGAAGILGGVPLMWVLMATALAFAATAHGILRTSEYRERKNPQNKLRYLGTHANPQLADLTRDQRRKLESNPGLFIPRKLEKIQIAVQLHNTAAFPVSYILEKADTIVDEIAPPRSVFPKNPIVLLPGNNVIVSDDMIAINKQCAPLKGKLDMVIKYGLPGKEIYSINLKGDIDVLMHADGVIQGILTHWG